MVPASLQGRYVIRFTVTSRDDVTAHRFTVTSHGTTDADIVRDWKVINETATGVLEAITADVSPEARPAAPGLVPVWPGLVPGCPGLVPECPALVPGCQGGPGVVRVGPTVSEGGPRVCGVQGAAVPGWSLGVPGWSQYVLRWSRVPGWSGLVPRCRRVVPGCPGCRVPQSRAGPWVCRAGPGVGGRGGGAGSDAGGCWEGGEADDDADGGGGVDSTQARPAATPRLRPQSAAQPVTTSRSDRLTLPCPLRDVSAYVGTNCVCLS